MIGCEKCFLLYVINVQPVGAICMFKVKEGHVIENTVAIYMFAIYSAGYPYGLPISNDILCMVKIYFQRSLTYPSD